MKKVISLLLCAALTFACAAALADGKVTAPAVETTEQAVAERTADVNGDGVEDVVTLLGTPFSETVYWENLHMTVKDGATGETTDVALAENAGYAPQLWIGALTCEEKNDIFVSTASGGSGGYEYSYNGGSDYDYDYDYGGSSYDYDYDYGGSSYDSGSIDYGSYDYGYDWGGD